MLLELVEQFVGFDTLLRQRCDLHDKPDGERVAIGIEERAAFDAAGGEADILRRYPLIVGEVETFLDGMRVETQHLFDAQRHLVGAKFALQSGFLRQERIGSIGGDDNGGVKFALLAAAQHAHDPVLLVQQIVHDRRGDERCSSLLGLLCQPAIKFGAQDGEAVVGRLREVVGAKVDGERGLLAQQRDNAPRQEAFDGCLFPDSWAAGRPADRERRGPRRRRF